MKINNKSEHSLPVVKMSSYKSENTVLVLEEILQTSVLERLIWLKNMKDHLT